MASISSRPRSRADGRDPTASDADVGLGAPIGGDDGSAADNEVECFGSHASSPSAVNAWRRPSGRLQHFTTFFSTEGRRLATHARYVPAL